MLDMLAKAQAFTFTPAIQIDAIHARPLVDALSNRWTFEPRRDRNVHWHLANAFSLVVERISPANNARQSRDIEVETDFQVGSSQNYTVRGEPEVETAFDPASRSFNDD